MNAIPNSKPEATLQIDPEYVAKSDLRLKADDHFYDLLTNAQRYEQSRLSTDDEICYQAEKIADRFSKFVNLWSAHEGLVQVICDIAYEKYHVIPPLGNATPENAVTVTVPLQEKFKVRRPVTVWDTVEIIEQENPKITVMVSVTGTVFRLCSSVWWRSALRKYYKRKFESEAIYFGQVHSRKGKYASDDAVQRHRKQKRRNRKFLEGTIATNELGQEFTLQELADMSVSNPTIKCAELFCRMRGFEEIAKAANHKCMFYTITCPSRMHARLSVSGERNTKYDGTTPKEAQEYLVKLFSQIRAKLARMEVTEYGMRIVEPQHDGTPHWHLAIFLPKKDLKRVTEVMKAYSLREDSDEPGAALHRFKAVYMDPKKGSATGYLFKYIMKNIDSSNLDCDIDGDSAIDTSDRVVAWANHWSIRQFQQVGGPPVGIWREIRRLGGNGLSKELKALLEAADNNRWDQFVMLLGGPNVKRKDLKVSLYKETSERVNQYLEPVGKVIKGVIHGTLAIITRIHTWVIKYKSDLGGPNSPPSNGNPPLLDPPTNPLYMDPLYMDPLPYGTLTIWHPSQWDPSRTSYNGGKVFEVDGALAPLEFCH